MKKKCYIAGPMTGYKDLNFEEFDNMEKFLTADGFEVVNPASIGRKMLKENSNYQYEEYLRADLKKLIECDILFILKGWRKSKGAKLEHAIAKALKMTICYQDKT